MSPLVIRLFTAPTAMLDTTRSIVRNISLHEQTLILLRIQNPFLFVSNAKYLMKETSTGRIVPRLSLAGVVPHYESSRSKTRCRKVQESLSLIYSHGLLRHQYCFCVIKQCAASNQFTPLLVCFDLISDHICRDKDWLTAPLALFLTATSQNEPL